MNTPALETLPPPRLEHVCDLAVTIAPPVEVGQTVAGLRRMIPITGGVVRGPRLNGKVLAGGADFQLILGGGTQARLAARYVIDLDDGPRGVVQNTALRVASLETSQRIMRGEPVNPSEIYFRCQPRFEATGQSWAWLAESQFVGSGRRAPDGVFLSFYRLC